MDLIDQRPWIRPKDDGLRLLTTKRSRPDFICPSREIVVAFVNGLWDRGSHRPNVPAGLRGWVEVRTKLSITRSFAEEITVSILLKLLTAMPSFKREGLKGPALKPKRTGREYESQNSDQPRRGEYRPRAKGNSYQ